MSFQEVDVERRDEHEVTVLSDVPVRPGQDLRLEVIGSGRRSTIHVRVAETTPIIVDGNVRYRLRLEIVV